MLAFTLLLVFMHGVRLVNPKSIETAINQNLSANSNVSSVRHFMDTNNILYTGYSPELRCVYGRVYRSSIGFMKGNIFIQFYFNVDSKLVSHRVSEGYQFAWE